MTAAWKRGGRRRGAAYRVAGALGARIERQYAYAKLAWLASCGADVGSDITAFGPFTFHGNPANLTIGDGCTINGGVVLNATAALIIGADVRLSTLAQLHTDELVPEDQSVHRHHRSGAIEIEQGAWVAAGAIVVPGISIGKGAIVAAGAVVVESVPAMALVAGVPAKVVRSL